MFDSRMASEPDLLEHVVKILNFVPLPDDEPIPVTLQFKACQNLSKALFIALSRQNEELLAQIVEHLGVLANSVIGVPMVFRCLLTGMSFFSHLHWQKSCVLDQTTFLNWVH